MKAPTLYLLLANIVTVGSLAERQKMLQNLPFQNIQRF